MDLAPGPMQDERAAPLLDVVARPGCPVCATPGTVLHAEVLDGFGLTANAWSFRQCPRGACGHAWLDPMPTAEALPQAYDSYPVHAAAQPRGAGPRPTLAGRAYLALRGALGIDRRREALERYRLPPGAGKRLLELGCGNGARLVHLRRLGYHVEGQEVSPAAAVTASASGIQVHLGDLERLALPPGSFDVLAMNHVLEHVVDPIAFLAQCRRLLAPGGRLASIQPNGSSLAHRRFGQDWVGLDPPRHLHVFTPQSLGAAAKAAGFARAKVATTFLRNEFCTRDSMQRRAMRTRKQAAGSPYPRMVASQLAALAVAPVARNAGDELTLDATR